MDTTDLASVVDMTGEQVSNLPADPPVIFTAGMNPPGPLYNFEAISNGISSPDWSSLTIF